MGSFASANGRERRNEVAERFGRASVERNNRENAADAMGLGAVGRSAMESSRIASTLIPDSRTHPRL